MEPEGSVQSGPSGQTGQQDVVTDVFGKQYPTLDPNVIYCGPGWGTKMCHFLHNHDGTVWADPRNQYSEYSDVKLTNFWDTHFISFLHQDSISTTCEGWRLGETTSNGAKWNIEIKKDKEDTFWFDYQYYGSSTEVQYTTTYKYQVIDGLLHFTSSDGRRFTFHPSTKDYAQELNNSGEVVRLDGCLFW